MQDKAKTSVIVLGLVGALALFGFRLMKTDDGRELAGEVTGLAENSEERVEREKFDKVLASNALALERAAKAHEKCGIAVPEEATFARTGSEDVRYSQTDIDCLEGQGIQRSVGTQVVLGF